MDRRPALIVVDMQRDFFPGGALPVREGERVVGPINKLISAFEKKGCRVFFTRDWHPVNHISFRFRGGLWPPHSVKNTLGSEFHPGLYVPKDAVIISKATKKNTEAYSGFEGTDLAEQLRVLHAKKLYVTGLATDYCVMNTALDGIAEGFAVTMVTDCVAGVNLKPTDSAAAFRRIAAAGAKKMTSREVIRMLNGRVAVSSSS